MEHSLKTNLFMAIVAVVIVLILVMLVVFGFRRWYVTSQNQSRLATGYGKASKAYLAAHPKSTDSDSS